ncbi:MAG TPA: TetR/AcrR family transcriptional regulator [Burkholderiales bacterium]|nr:TetR/AcrR family transcriptional regulator [Burkholderiales bacterium]
MQTVKSRQPRTLLRYKGNRKTLVRADSEAAGGDSTSPLRGVTPIRQARSEATFRALIRAGRKALDEKSFDEMTVEEIARSAGASVGAFYGRFANKEAFFSAIQELAVSDIEAQLAARLAEPEVEAASDAQFLAAVARATVDTFRRHRGLYIASFKHSSTRPGAWTPIRQLGYTASGLIAARLQPRLQRLGKPANEREIRIGLQFMSGLLVNAVLNDPGPLSLDDKEMDAYIARFLCSFFGVKGDGKTSSAK